MKFETLQSESPVTWLNEVLVLLSVALQRAQQLRDKVIYCNSLLDIGMVVKFLLTLFQVSVFLQYQIHNVSSVATPVPLF